jgi:hypothetical protein
MPSSFARRQKTMFGVLLLYHFMLIIHALTNAISRLLQMRVTFAENVQLRSANARYDDCRYILHPPTVALHLNQSASTCVVTLCQRENLQEQTFVTVT